MEVVCPFYVAGNLRLPFGNLCLGLLQWNLSCGKSLVIGLAGGYRGVIMVKYMLLMAVGHFISTMLGAAIGGVSRNQMMATGISIPIMMVFSFLPMLSMFNATIETFAGIFYSQQINRLSAV